MRLAGQPRSAWRPVKTPIYLDYAATTPADPAVVAVMSRYLGPDGVFGNPASRFHSFGRDAEEAVEQARVHVADLINGDPREIVLRFSFGRFTTARQIDYAAERIRDAVVELRSLSPAWHGACITARRAFDRPEGGVHVA